jgi:hypothetical protein
VGADSIRDLVPLQLRKESPLQRAPTDRLRFFSLWERIISAISFIFFVVSEAVVVVVVVIGGQCLHIAIERPVGAVSLPRLARMALIG